MEGQCQERSRKGRGEQPARVGKNGRRSRRLETARREDGIYRLM